MYSDVCTYCEACPKCVISTGGSWPGKPPLSLIPVSRAFQIADDDLMELPVTTQGNRYVVVSQDFLPK